MRTIFIMFISLLLLLSILVHQAQGIRLVPERAPKVTDSVKKAKFDDTGDSSLMWKRTDGCLESGRIRKLVTKPTTSISPFPTPPKYDKNDDENGNGGQEGHSINERTAGDKVETFPVHSSTLTNQHLQHNADLQRFPDVFDIAGMDYSPARRKPSIHN